MSCIAVKNITFAFEKNARPVLNDVSFTVPEGQITGLAGPNGAGKTTLLRLVSGFLRPQSGACFFDDADLTGFPAAKISRILALVAQNTSMLYDFSVFDIVLSGRNPYVDRFKGETEKDFAIARESLETVGIADLADRSILSLSGGERQMVFLARALAQQSPVMLLDEPVTGLDIRHQIRFLSVVRRLSREKNLTVLTVLHDLNLCLAFCDRVVLLKNGSVFVEGDSAEVLSKERIEAVYETPVQILNHDGLPFILPTLQ